MDVATFLQEHDFALKPKDTTARGWDLILERAGFELQQTGENPYLRQVIAYLTKLLDSRRLVAHEPESIVGVPELYWFHHLRRELQETETPFSVKTLKHLLPCLRGKIDLLAAALHDPKEHRGRALAFLQTWRTELKKHTKSTVIKP